MTKPRPAEFKWRQFEPQVIFMAVGWYLRFSLSYRDVEVHWRCALVPTTDFSAAIRRINSRMSLGRRGLLEGFDFQRQNSRNPWRCQRMKVSGLTTTSDIRQSNSRLTVTISHLVASLARCGLTRLSWKTASCFCSGAMGAMLFVDPESNEGMWLHRALEQEIAVVPDARLASSVSELRTFVEQPIESMEVGELSRHCVHALSPGAPPARRLDERITKVLEAIRARDDLRMSLEDAAQLAFLSPQPIRAPVQRPGWSSL